ncbi:hypothetical protein FIV42_26710 [Persicimonas caeni]|uniref:Uncharacterized protein n=1 Tax=Persicimonas caeni TaxID=2292766 RepID=A0A4Y6Q0U8_PERCE|nr:hypothetical protein [Persicimonas caeni]QDG54204.1 hypothetical protein FIV42_26710 [Persicimonas caeni]QED35425.1 hypothetical protein FRD00_26705 [Persicimonas caeni]
MQSLLTTRILAVLVGALASVCFVGCQVELDRTGQYFRCETQRDCSSGYECVSVDGQLACVPSGEVDGLLDASQDATTDAADTSTPTDTGDTDTSDAQPSDVGQPDADSGDDVSTPDGGCTPCEAGCSADLRQKIVCADTDGDGCEEPRAIECDGTRYCDTITNECEFCGNQACNLNDEPSCTPAGIGEYSTFIRSCVQQDDGCGELVLEECVDGVCVADTSPYCAVHECNQDQCSPSLAAILRCQTDSLTGQRKLVTGQQCSPNQRCQSTNAGPACVCQHQCSPGQERCNGDTYQTCVTGADGCHIWQSDTTCQGSSHNATFGCSNGVQKCVNGPTDACLKPIVEQCPNGQTCTQTGPGSYLCQ